MGAVKAQLLDRPTRVTCPTCKGSGKLTYRASRFVTEIDGYRRVTDRRPTTHYCGTCGGLGALDNTPLSSELPF